MRSVSAVLLAIVLAITASSATAQEKKPNILVIMGDDIGSHTLYIGEITRAD
jgi:hypothetical protein